MKKFKEFVQFSQVNEEVDSPMDKSVLDKILKDVSQRVKSAINLDVKLTISGSFKNARGGVVYSELDNFDVTKKIPFKLYKRISVTGDISVGNDGSSFIKVRYSYDMFDGGRNGTSIGSFTYKSDGSLLHQNMDIK